MKKVAWIHRWVALMVVLLVASTAGATVRREGDWPEEDKSISVDLTAVPRAEAVRKVAAAAGWNIVFRGLSDERVDVHVKNQPAMRVLDLVLGDGKYTAQRDHDLIQIKPDDEAAPSAAPSAAAASSGGRPSLSLTLSADPAPSSSASDSAADGKIVIGKKHKHNGKNDRTLFGGYLRVEKDETVDDVAVLGGAVDVLGKTGDIAVFGGNVHVYPGAHVTGDIAVLGGSVTVDDDATVDGELVTVGGALHRAERAHIGGEVKAFSDEFDSDHGADRWSVSKVFSRIGAQITKAALLFMLGAVVIALSTRRMQMLESEIALRPMRSIAMGLAAIVVGSVLLVLLCVTVVGIPVALGGILIAILGAYAGICAALSAMGHVIVADRSANPYVHLAVGCAVFLIAGFIPYFGGLVTFVVLLAGFGAFAATRAAGFIPANR